jgi:hypothetical protein
LAAAHSPAISLTKTFHQNGLSPFNRATAILGTWSAILATEGLDYGLTVKVFSKSKKLYYSSKSVESVLRIESLSDTDKNCRGSNNDGNNEFQRQ